MTSSNGISKSAENKELTSSATKTNLEDDWQIITEEDAQPLARVETLEKLEPYHEHDPKEALSEANMEKEKCTNMQAQQGDVYPQREVKIPSYPQFIGNW
ncbi:hypothetical protein ACHAPQ_006842 [Fusarium lateritium]